MDHSSFFLGNIESSRYFFSRMIGVIKHWSLWNWEACLREVALSLFICGRTGTPVSPSHQWCVLSSQLWHRPLSPPWFLPGAVGWTPYLLRFWRDPCPGRVEHKAGLLNGDYTGCVWTTSYFREVLVEGGSNKKYTYLLTEHLLWCSSALKGRTSPFSWWKEGPNPSLTFPK